MAQSDGAVTEDRRSLSCATVSAGICGCAVYFTAPFAARPGTRSSMTTPEPERSLDRALSRRDLTAFAVNRVIGAGIFGLPAVLYAGVGPPSVVAMLLAAILIALITVCFAEVGSRYRDTGGPYLYAHEAFGPVVGFEVGWLMWVTQLGGFAAVINLLVNYAGWFVPAITAGPWRVVIITAVIAALAVVNILGVRRAAILNNVLTVGKLVPLAAFVLVGLFFLETDLFVATPTLANDAGLAGAVFLAIYAYSGFETIGVPSGEVQDPSRSIPFALLGGLAVVATVYLGVQVVAVGTLPDLGTSSRPLADAADRIFGGWGGAFMAVGAIISTLGVAHAIILSAGRMPFAMAERGQLPNGIAAVHPRYHTPYVSILVSVVCMWVFTLVTTFTSALTFTVGLRVIIYLTTCASLPVLRRGGVAAPFVLPGGPVVAVACILVCVVLLALRPWAETLQLLLFVATGLVLWAAVGRRMG